MTNKKKNTWKLYNSQFQYLLILLIFHNIYFNIFEVCVEKMQFFFLIFFLLLYLMFKKQKGRA